MTLTIELTPEEEARLERAAQAQGKPVEELVRTLIAQLPAIEPPAAQRARALFAAWDAEDETDDPEEIARRNREWESFRDNMNANRAAEGRPPVYP